MGERDAGIVAPGRGWAVGAAAAAAAIVVLCLTAVVIAGEVVDSFWLLSGAWYRFARSF